MLDSPGPLEPSEKAFFAITPVPEDWPEERKESYLREDNARILRSRPSMRLSPGTTCRASTGTWRRRCCARSSASAVPRGLGRIRDEERWTWYGAEDPSLMLVHWKFYLRSITNAIIDARIHVHGMTEEEAVSLMVEGGFQEEAEARNKFDRARLSSTKLSTYYTGSMEFWDIEREVRRRAAAASGDPRGADAVPEPRVVGGYGETPGFTYLPHLENLIAHGAPPTSLLRRLVLD